MNEHALEVLEFGRVLDRIAARASSELGRDAIRALRPTTERAFLEDELGRVSETLRLIREGDGWAPPPVPDARGALERLSLEGGVLEGVHLHRLGTLLSSGRELHRALGGAGSGDRLRALGRRLHRDADAEEDVARTVDPEGEVLDTASRELRRLRDALRKAHGRIVRKLEEFLGRLPERWVLPDASVSIREGRYVVPIRREGRGEVGGVVHGESSTGATLFVEPPLALGLMNELKELEAAESREVVRILRAFSERLRPDREALAASQEALVAFDSLHARARSAEAWDGEPPELLPTGSRGLEVVGGRHPLLLESDEPEEVVPFDLSLDPEESVVVVSGPNTGGKTVFLKGLGLVSVLAQSGVVPPVAAGTRLPLYDEVFADIGDEQSIARSLSTFSAHLSNLREIVEGAGEDSLVLVDEIGTGTDPAEGAALARAIVDTLVERRATAVVTSHLGQLKRLDTDGSGVVNASLQFDPDRMAPTYRLVKGRPGRSYGLAIARRLGFPAGVLDRAEEHLSSGEASVEDLLETLERKEKEAADRVAELERERAEAARLRGELEERESELRERETELREAERGAERRAREEARRLLMEARGEVEEAIREVRGAADGEAVEEAATRARRRVEAAAGRQRREAPEPGGSGPSREPPPLAEGQRVRLLETGTSGRITELREETVVVEAGGLRLTVPARELVPVEGDGGRKGEGGGGRSRRSVGRGGGGAADLDAELPGADPAAEVDLRGLRVDEVGVELDRALEAALRSGTPEVRIIHGKGTGAVRSRVRELLRTDRRAGSFRAGEREEGGSGVTVVSLS